jgi:hypothetical protein
MKHEALKALMMQARKKMAEDESSETPAVEVSESPAHDKMEALLGTEKEPAVEGDDDAAPGKLEDVLSFLKARAVPAPTSKMAAVSVKVSKPKGANLFKKK